MVVYLLAFLAKEVPQFMNAQDNIQINYPSLVLGFSSAALAYMGFMPVDDKGTMNVNLDLAKQNIDIISLLQEKTRGNLSDEESQLTDQVLTDLRIKYVEKCK